MDQTLHSGFSIWGGGFESPPPMFPGNSEHPCSLGLKQKSLKPLCTNSEQTERQKKPNVESGFPNKNYFIIKYLLLAC
jgi:hypothetical protein